MTARPNLPAVAAAPLASRIERQWDADIVPQLVDYIRIPAKSPHFDPDWAQQRPHRGGHPAGRDVGEGAGASRASPLEIVRIEGRTPVLFFDIPGHRRPRATTARCSSTATSTSSPR